MQIIKNSVVSMDYELSIKSPDETDFDLIEEVPADDPLVFIHGLSGYPEMFEAQLLGKKAGDEFEFIIPPVEGYGDFDENALVELPFVVFEVDGQIDLEMLQEGRSLPMTDAEGNHLSGMIREVNNETKQVVMDFNHPLAGMELHFSGKILGVRPATQDELEHGHVHGEGGVQH